jgi:PPP family 3-phenylpropionic acid transporter
MPEALPYWRLSGFYFAYFAVLGIVAPYWGPYLDFLGFSAAEIGELIAILHATKIIAPNVWGWIADHTGHRMGVVRLASVGALVIFSGVLFARDYWVLAGLMAAFSFFWHAAIPQFEANTMNHLGDAHHRYSRIRLWGSVGFIVSVLVVGELTDRLDFGIVPPIMLGLFALLAVVAAAAPQALQPQGATDQPRLFHVLRQPVVLGLFATCFLLQASHGPFYAFYSIYLQDHGYSGSAIGALWSLGVIAEIGAFLIMDRLLPRFGPKRLMVTVLALAALRWTLVATFVDELVVQAGAQLLHAASFGIYHAVAISLVNRFFVGPNQGRGQALYSSLTFGAGVAVGSLGGGYVFDAVGGAATFYMAASAAALGSVVAARFIPWR